MSEKKKRREKIICPRCGKLGHTYTRTIGNRQYLYIVHGAGRNKKFCYIGPVGGYFEVERIHKLDLKDALNVDYVETALRALENFQSKLERGEAEITEKTVEKLEQLRALIDYLESLNR